MTLPPTGMTAWAVKHKPKADMVRLARERVKLAEESDPKQRERENEDIAFYDGDQWDQQVKQARAGLNTQTPGQTPAPSRPTYTINRVREPVRQVLNQERQADMSVEIIAADDFGGLPGGAGVDDLEIELREGLVRRIQRESEAEDARSWAFSRAAIAGVGYYLVTSEYLPGSFDQDIRVKKIFDQRGIRLDPAHQQQDGSDAHWGFEPQFMPWDEYQATFPDGPDKDTPNRISTASPGDFSALVRRFPEWFRETGETRSVLIVNYYYVEMEPQELVLLADGRTVPLEHAPKGVAVLARRSEVKRTVKWARIDGLNEFPLEETEVPCPWVPIVKVVGEELHQYDEQRRTEGMVRTARDAQKGANALVSKMVEHVAMTPIAQIMMAAGQDENFEPEWDNMQTRTINRLHYNQVDVDGRPAPQPSPLPIDPNLAPIVQSLSIFNEAVISTIGRPDPTNIQPQGRSGEYLKRLFAHADMGTSGYLDNLARSIRHEGRIINAMLQPIYGNRPGRLAKMVTGEKAGSLETQTVPLGMPFMPPPLQPPGPTPPGPAPRPQIVQGWQPGQPVPPGAKLYTLTPGVNFNVAVKVSKNYDTRREAEDAQIGEIIAADPSQLMMLGYPYFKYKDGPGAKELAEIYKVMAPPPLQALFNGQQAPDPQTQQLLQENQQLKQMLGSKQAEAQAKGQVDLQKTAMQEQGENERAQFKAMVDIQIAEIKAKQELDKAQLMSQMEAIRLALEANQETRLDMQAARHEHLQNVQARAHDVGMAQLEHQQALEQGQQAAALAPTPQATNGSGFSNA